MIERVQVKRILVAQRENPIVNRLNKTKVEKFPDLAMEKEERLKSLRKKDQAAKLERVSFLTPDPGSDMWANWDTEKGRGKNSAREEGEEVAERSCI